MNTYPATLKHLVDADTLDLDIDVGFGIRVRERVRLLGLNTPEKNTPAGKAANAWATDWLNQHAPELVVETHRKEKYGRWLATITAADGACLNSDLLEAGHAAPYDGRGLRPVPEPKE
ncbi:thermonuclease family protein [Streptomyces sp. V1I1]|uniref:thermonuclease family protein n=1 Tax=Streptomyces sp. V1I1 TaxID=3042272 RepID=UPI002789D264|nr:thermonuclease family protein [Streptomyces sp. V1I1]MDQ0946008.1 micrococcal nuclease [Streptomyces sp. V1I1]